MTLESILGNYTDAVLARTALYEDAHTWITLGVKGQRDIESVCEGERELQICVYVFTLRCAARAL